MTSQKWLLFGVVFFGSSCAVDLEKQAPQDDGATDKGDACSAGSLYPCGTSEVGECRRGLQPCNDGVLGECEGNIEPTTEFCDGKDNDCNGEIDDGLERSCSNVCGSGVEVCVNGKWGACSAITQCDCTPGTIETVDCGDCGVQSRECSDERAWGPFSPCDDPGNSCSPPGTRRCVDATSFQVCDLSGDGCLEWLTPQQCPANWSCSGGDCIEGCAPDCLDKSCGSDGCGGSCGNCSAAQFCNPADHCEDATVTDLFLIIGQSNAVGYGQGVTSVNSVPGAYEIDYAGGTNAFLPLVHPTGRGSGPQYESQDIGFGLALAKTWNSLRHESVFVFAAVKGSALVEAADNGIDGDWTDAMDNDGLYTSALILFSNAKSAVQSTANRILGKIVVVWHQGETDALHPAVKEQDYLTGMNGLYLRLLNDISFDAMLVSSIGFTTNDPAVNTPRFIEIMDAQEKFANKAGLATALASRKAMTLTRHCFAEGLSSSACGLRDDYHYKASVYEALGEDIALNGWHYVMNGTRMLDASSYPAAEVKCIGDTTTETAIITAYNTYCYRCPSVVDLNYWVNGAMVSGLEPVLASIQSICDDYGYPGWTACQRQEENALLATCPAGWDFLPTYSKKCFSACQF